MAADPGEFFELESPQTSIAMEESKLSELEEPLVPLQDMSKTRESKREAVMEWMESQYPVLAEAIITTQTVDSFHLAEENKQEFPHDDALKVAEEMATKLLSNAKQDIEVLSRRRVYLKSMFFCVTPESLTPLAAMLYQELEKTWTYTRTHGTENLLLRMVFQYEDEKKVIQLCICLFVRGLLKKEAEQICRESDKKRVQETMEDMINKELKGAPMELLAASEDVRRSLYSAYRGWREIPLTDAEHITEAMLKHLTGSDKERKAYLASVYFSLNHHALLPLVIAMFQKYREICPDKLELLKGNHNEEWNPKYLGRVLSRRNVLTKEEYDKFNTKLTPEELSDRKKQRRSEFEVHNLEVFFDQVWEEEPYSYDILDYQRCQLPYDDAVAVSKLMLPFLNGNVRQRKIYLKTMNNLSYRKKFWVLEDIAVAELTKTYLPGHESIIGEYNNVAVLMCQQYMDQFPDLYSELEKHIFPHYIHLFFVKSLWQQNVLSEVAISFCIKSILCHERDELTISHGLRPLLFSLPTTVYMPAIVSSDASDFSRSVWIQSSDDFTQTSFMRILVDAAIEREKQSHPKNEARYQVVVKALSNQESAVAKVELILDVLLPQLQPQDCDVWDRTSNSTPLYILAARRRGSQFVDVAFKLLEFLERSMDHKQPNPRVMQLIHDKDTDDHTVMSIISKMIESKTIVAFSDTEKGEFVRHCTGEADHRSLTATMLWKFCSHLKFLDLISNARNESIPLAVLEEFNIDLCPDQSKIVKTTNSLHVAAEKGYTSIVKLALERGFNKLLKSSNEKDQYPVQLALEKNHYVTAAVMLRAMNDRTLCLAESNGPRVNFRNLLDEMKCQCELKIIWKIYGLLSCVMAILDSTVHSNANYHEVLEVDYKGNMPKNEDFVCPSEHSIELIMRHQEYFPFKEIIIHESFQSLVNCKWNIYGRKLFMLYFVTYLFFLALLTTTFVLGATKAGSPSEYNQPLDWFRLFCEIVVLLLIIYDIMLEIKQFYHIVRHSFSKWRVYVYDWTNWLDDTAILLTLLVIPFRIADFDEQWVFVALAYILHCLRLFKYAIIKSSFAVYVKTLFQIIKSDIVQFLTVFLVVTISFGGGLYFSLRSHPCGLADQMTTDEAQFNFSPVINTSLCQHPDETNQIYLSWLTGIRLLLEGNIIDPYIFGDRGFWWFSAMIYMIFLFLVAVIMLNLLIAQFNKSYEEITKNATKTITPERARILVKQQSSLWIQIFCFKLGLGQRRTNLMSSLLHYRFFSERKKTDDENFNDFEKINDQFMSSTSTDQKQFKDLRSQLKEVKADIAKSTKELVTTDCLREEMNNQAAQIEAVQSEVKGLKSEMKTLVTAFREQTELVIEQQRQIKESLKSLGEVKDFLQKVQEK